MRPIAVLKLVFLATLLLVCGCASDNKGKIEGTKWVSVPANVKGRNVPAGALKLEFAKDGSMVYEVGPTKYTGKYSLGVGSAVTFKLDQELAGQKNHREKVVIKGDQMTVADSDGTSLTFEKVK